VNQTASGEEFTHLVFAVGTLKRGFPLHQLGIGESRFRGEYRSVERYPLVIAGPWYAPMLFHEPGNGERVVGELYEVAHRQLSNLDRIESVGLPGNYRYRLAVEGVTMPEIQLAFAYFKSRDLAVPVHTGFLAAYHDHRFIPPDQRVSCGSPSHAMS